MRGCLRSNLPALFDWQEVRWGDCTWHNVPAMSVHCCDRMDYDLNQKCNVHASRSDCPDALISLVRGGYGLIVHNGGSSVIEIKFCPWCGSSLPKIDEISEVSH